MNRRKELIRTYKQTPKQMGVYRIHNTATGQSLIASGNDVQARLNRHRTELKWGSHRHAVLQADWNTYGSEAFVFEVLDTLEPSEEPSYDPAEDLQALEALWVEKIDALGEARYL